HARTSVDRTEVVTAAEWPSDLPLTFFRLGTMFPPAFVGTSKHRRSRSFGTQSPTTLGLGRGWTDSHGGGYSYGQEAPGWLGRIMWDRHPHDRMQLLQLPRAPRRAATTLLRGRPSRCQRRLDEQGTESAVPKRDDE